MGNDHGSENQPLRYALPEIVGDEFVGRREELTYLRHVIGRAPRRLAYSIALIARKGMGKTALMQRFFNLTFFDRDFGVAPIYLSLAEYRFIRQSYYRNILRWSDREIENSWQRRYMI